MEIQIEKPIPMQLIQIQNMSESSSFQTPLNFLIENSISNFQKIKNEIPPNKNPIPFDSVNFNNFKLNFESPIQNEMEFCDEDEFLDKEFDFDL